MKTYRTSLITVALCGGTATGCGLEKLPDDGSSGGGIPRIVQAELTASCAIPGCHSAGFTAPDLSETGAAGIVGAESGAGIPYVTFGSLEESYLAHKLLGEDAPLPIVGTVMPPTGRLPDDKLAVILGWILVGNDPFEGAEEAADTDSDTSTDSGDTTTTTSTDTGDTGDTSDTGDTGESSSTGLSHARNIQPIWTARCALGGCHANTYAPELSDGAAYAAIVDVNSAASGVPFIASGDHENSYIWQKLTGAAGIIGTPMPPPLGGLDPTDIAIIQQWIDEGAAP